MLNTTSRQLEVFTEAARTGSFARAAERLFVTPAAVSFQMRQLESLIGLNLFERTGKRVILTEPGETLLAYARTILQALQDADRALMALKGLMVGRITIGIVSTAKYIVPHILAQFRTEHPGVEMHLRDGNRREIYAALERGEVDLAVTGQPPEGMNVIAAAFAAHPSVLVAAPGHPLGVHGALPASMLAGEAFIAREEGAGTRHLMDSYFRSAGLVPRVTMTSSSNETIKQAVMAGMGIALLSRHTIGLELRLGLLRTLPAEGFPLMREWFVVYRAGMPLLPIHARLRDFLKVQGARTVAEIEEGAARALSLPPPDAVPLRKSAPFKYGAASFSGP